MNWRGGHHQRLLTLLILGVAVTALLIGSFAVFIGARSQNPIQQAASVTADLYSTTKQLQQSFGNQDTKTAKVARAYLSYLARIRKDCTDISRYQASATKAGLSPESASVFSNSISLCDDLTKVAKGSEAIYKPTLPLLTASTQVKRYQLFPPLKSHIRSGNITDTAQALKAISASTDIPADFPTQVASELRQLQNAIKSSHDLGYMPSLQTFQVQLLTERERYWNDYVGLSTLVKSLQKQQDNYCLLLLKTDNQPGFCHA